MTVTDEMDADESDLVESDWQVRSRFAIELKLLITIVHNTFTGGLSSCCQVFLSMIFLEF